MIANITMRSNFSTIVKYIFNASKGTELLASEGVRLKDLDSISKSFETQAEVRPISKPVYHISLNFSPNDREKLSNSLISIIANEYLNRMGLVDTQYIIGKHNDKEHPHIHISCNRINNQGKTISDKNDRFRSERICKELTLKYGLYYAQGKENVNECRLKEPDATKYQIYSILKTKIPRCENWKELIEQLKCEGVDLQLVYKGKTNIVQGAIFSKNGFQFSGSKVDRQFSYSKISNQFLNQNRSQNGVTYFQLPDNPIKSIAFMPEEKIDDIQYTLPINYNSGSKNNDDLNSRKKKKKKKKMDFGIGI